MSVRGKILGNVQTFREAFLGGDIETVTLVIQHYPGDGWKMALRQVLVELMIEDGLGRLKNLLNLDAFASVVDPETVGLAHGEAEWWLGLRRRETESLRSVVTDWRRLKGVA